MLFLCARSGVYSCSVKHKQKHYHNPNWLEKLQRGKKFRSKGTPRRNNSLPGNQRQWRHLLEIVYSFASDTSERQFRLSSVAAWTCLSVLIIALVFGCSCPIFRLIHCGIVSTLTVRQALSLASTTLRLLCYWCLVFSSSGGAGRGFYIYF